MAQNTTVAVAAGTWTQLTDADAATVSFQNVGTNYVMIKATADTTTPTTEAGALKYSPGQGERSVTLASMFPGITTPVRVWAYSPTINLVFISHA